MALIDLVGAVAPFSIIFLIWLTSTIYIIRQFYCSEKKSEKLEINGYLRKTALSYMISYTIAYFCALLLAALALSNVSNFFHSPHGGYQILIIIISLSTSIGFVSFYLFVATRLYYSFKPTMYAIKKRIIYMYIILSIIIAILFNVYAAMYFLLQPLLPNSFLSIALPPALVAVIINLYIAISLIYHFTNNLTKCASVRRETSSDNVLSPRQTSYINVASRHCVLSCVAIALFNIGIPLTICSYVWILPHDISTFTLTAALCFLFHTTEMICVLLGFSFNKKYYYKWCSFCDNRCHHWLTNVAAKNLKNPAVKQITINSTTKRNNVIKATSTMTVSADATRDATHDVTATNGVSSIEINSIATGSYITVTDTPTRAQSNDE